MHTLCLLGCWDAVQSENTLFWSSKKWLSISCNLEIGHPFLIYSRGFVWQNSNPPPLTVSALLNRALFFLKNVVWKIVEIIASDETCLWWPQKKTLYISGWLLKGLLDDFWHNHISCVALTHSTIENHFQDQIHSVALNADRQNWFWFNPI